jgi:hypothetical protein
MKFDRNLQQKYILLLALKNQKEIFINNKEWGMVGTTEVLYQKIRKNFIV